MVFTPKFGKLVRRAVAAGGGSPLDAEPAAPPPAVPAPDLYPIPDDWQSLPWPQLRSLAANISDTDGPVHNKAEAIARIEAELARRG